SRRVLRFPAMAAAYGDSLAISIKPLHPLFGVEICQVEIGRLLDDSTVAEIRAAFEEYSLLLFREQELDDDTQIAFSERFEPLETTVKANPAGGTYFARQSNLDVDTGAVIRWRIAGSFIRKPMCFGTRIAPSSACRRCARCSPRASCRQRAVTPSSQPCAPPMPSCPRR